jgi:hypothetical protein
MKRTTKAEAASRVARGVKWLDEAVPDWRSKIDLQELDLTSECNCVLGQLFGDFFTPLDNGTLTMDEAIACGFDEYEAENDSTGWENLAYEWLLAVEVTP